MKKKNYLKSFNLVFSQSWFRTNTTWSEKPSYYNINLQGKKLHKSLDYNTGSLNGVLSHLLSQE